MTEIAFNEGCVVERERIKLGGMSKSKKEILFGKFIDEYNHFYLFSSSSGYRECFSKNSHGLDWRIVER